VDKKTKRRVKGIAIFIVFMALAATIIQFQKDGAKRPSFNFKPSFNEYRDLKFINKAQISFTADNITKAQDGIGQIMANRGKQRIRKQNEGSFGAYIFTIPQGELQNVIGELRTYGSIGSQVEQIDTSLVNLDFESESARLKSYETELSDLSNLRFPTDAQNRRKEALHGLIHTSRLNLDKLSEGENVLLYITLSPKQKDSNMLTMIKTLTMNFLQWLLLFSVGMVLVFYGTKLLMYFLSAIGVKGISAGGLGGNYNYGGYGGYSSYAKYSSRYGYGGRSRKVKRIYKDKGAPSTEEPEEDNK